MGAPWTVPTDHPLINAWSWSLNRTAVAYGEHDWPSRSYTLFVFEAE